MNEFTHDVVQRKRLARNAYAKKNGSRSKKCTLPSDYLSKKEWNARNGKVVSMKMDQVTDWKTFRMMSHDIQEEYLKRLVQKYDCTGKDIAQMFGITNPAFYNYVSKHKLRPGFVAGHIMPKDKRAEWERFIEGTNPEDETVEVQQEDTPIECELEAPAPEAPAVARPSLHRFELHFCGEIDIMDVFNSVKAILGTEKIDGQIDITVSK